MMYVALLLLSMPQSEQVAKREYGAGTVIIIDLGYYQYYEGKKFWTPQVKELILEGMTDPVLTSRLRPGGPYYVFRPKGFPLRGWAELLTYDKIRNVRKVGTGRLRQITYSEIVVTIRDEP